MMHRFGRNGLLIVTVIMLCWGVTHAALSNYQQKERAIRDSCQAARNKLTPQEQKQLQCNTPEIRLMSPAAVKPGETTEVAITGKFPAGTSFVFHSDSVEVLKESSNANSYRATIKVASGGGPEDLSISAIIPPCCKSAYQSNALHITGNFEWELKGANGWTVKAHSIAPAAGERQTGELAYLLEFFRGAETKPFEKRSAKLHPEQSAPPRYYFSISKEDESSMNSQREMQAIAQQMQNPNLSDADREKLMIKMQEMIARMTGEAQKMSSPAYIKQIQAKELEFGCTAINLQLQNGVATGNMLCSDKVGRNIALTGSMKYLGK
jgi:hypothetical protein